MKPAHLFATALTLLFSTPAVSEWQLILSDQGRRVELDRATITRSDRDTKVAWGRVVLSPDQARQAGYTVVKALNRYDCMNRGFSTVKRVYLDETDRVLREEAATEPEPVMVTCNSVDERMWREVCRPPSATDLTKIAREAGRSAANAQSKQASPSKAKTKQAAPATSASTQTATPKKTPPQTSPPDSKSIEGTPEERTTAAASPMPAQTPPSQAPSPTSRSPSQTLPPRSSPPTATAAHKTSTTATIPITPTGWHYSGDTGPEHWGQLRPEWRLCAEGKRQSPVDLHNGIVVDLEPVKFDYRSSRFRITNTGNTLRVDVGDGSGIELRGRRYALESFTLHRPSATRIDGQMGDMSVQFFHREPEGRMAILEVILELGESPNALIQTVLNNIPLEADGNYMPAAPLDLSSFLPASPAHYLYAGSLPTPPCTEGVTWVVMKQTVPVNAEQLAVFGRLYPHNVRPPQPLNDRLILESR